MNNILRLSFVLSLVTAIAAFVLAEIYSITKPRIEEQKLAKTNAALEFVLPQAKKIEPVNIQIPIKDSKGNVLYEKDQVSFYKAFSDENKSELVGYAFKAMGNGYTSGSPIETMVGIDLQGQITNIKIVSQKETPGLGALCENRDEFEGNKWSTRQFIGKSREELKVDKDGGEIVSITGATITSRAITNSIRAKLGDILQDIEQNN